jgi:hypothetical protein
MVKLVKKTVVFSVEYKTEIEVFEDEMIDSNIDLEIPSGAYCGCEYVENSLKVLSSSKSEIKMGDKVSHKNYGEGIVTNITKLDSLLGGGKSIEIDNRHSDYEINFNKI